MDQRRIVRVLAAITAEPLGSLADRCVPRDGEALQAELGDGPSYTSWRSGEPVLVPDVRRDHTWPAFGHAATALGLCSVFAFPLRRAAARSGALTLYRDVEAAFTDDHHADALIYARLGHDLVVSMQTDHPADELDELIVDGTADTAEIHQAAGVVSVQLGIDVTAALAVLRARAFANDRSLRDVATDVVSRRVRFGD